MKNRSNCAREKKSVKILCEVCRQTFPNAAGFHSKFKNQNLLREREREREREGEGG